MPSVTKTVTIPQEYSDYIENNHLSITAVIKDFLSVEIYRRFVEETTTKLVVLLLVLLLSAMIFPSFLAIQYFLYSAVISIVLVSAAIIIRLLIKINRVIDYVQA